MNQYIDQYHIDQVADMVGVLRSNGWTFASHGKIDTGWWMHAEKMPYRRGDPKNFWRDALTVYDMYADLPKPEPKSLLEIVYGAKA
jgi:hypothetical protein